MRRGDDDDNEVVQDRIARWKRLPLDEYRLSDLEADYLLVEIAVRKNTVGISILRIADQKITIGICIAVGKYTVRICIRLRKFVS